MVEDSPTKQIGKELENLITEKNADDKEDAREVDSKEESFQSSSDKSQTPESAKTSNNGPIYNMVSKLWGGTVSNDLDISDDTEEESEINNDVDLSLKRKFLVSPGSKVDTKGKKERKNKNSLNKSN